MLRVVTSPIMLSVIMLSVVMLSVVMLSVIMLSVVMLSVVMTGVITVIRTLPGNRKCGNNLVWSHVPSRKLFLKLSRIEPN
jgi:hypothetical protein